MWGTDQKASLEIRGMDALARRVHSVRLIAGDGVKVVSGEELKVRQKLRG
jgi:sialic acid synthase SpsE